MLRRTLKYENTFEIVNICKVLYADYCRRDYVYGFGVIDAPLKTGKKCAQDAVRLRPDSHEAHFVLGQILFYFV